MLMTTMAYLGQYLSEIFNIEPSRVRMCDREHLVGEVSSKTNKLQLPMVSYSIEGIGYTELGRRKMRGTFKGSSNASQTEAVAYYPMPVRATVRLGIICRDILQSFDVINSYFSILGASEFTLTFHCERDLMENMEVSIRELEELTVPPGMKESRSYEEAGLLYTLDGGFTVMTNLLYYDKTAKLVRATKLDYNIYGANGVSIPYKNAIRESVGDFVKYEG